MAGTILAVPAIGFTAIYAVLRFPNFAIASHLTIGAFAGWLANVSLGLPAALAVGVAFAAAGVAGVVSDELILKPLRPAGALTTAIAAVALTLVLENVIRFVFGNDLRGYALPIRRDWQVAGLRIAPQQVQNFGLAVVAMAAVFLFLAFTRTGKAMRAVADNPTLASVKGIDTDRVARLTTFVAMGLAGVGGVLLGLDTSIDPLTGFRVILSVFAAGVVGLGAYVSALLCRQTGAPIVVGIAAAALAAAGAGAAVALATARLRGDYLAIITLGFSEVVRLVASNELWLTNGTDGISGIPGPWRGRVAPQTFNVIYLAIVVLAVLAVLTVCERIRHSPYGRVLRAIRDDDQVAAVAGKRVIAFKVQAFAVSAAILGLAGALWGHYTSFIAPDVFTPLVTIYVVLALTAGA